MSNPVNKWSSVQPQGDTTDKIAPCNRVTKMTGSDLTSGSVPGTNVSGGGVSGTGNGRPELTVAANDDRIARVAARGLMLSHSLIKACSSSLRQPLPEPRCGSFGFPPVIRGAVEALLFSSVFIAAGIISLGIGIKEMLVPMVPFVLMMMFCMVASGVYRNEITHSILNLYIHSIYGFFLASVGVFAMTFIMPVEFSQPKFVFFFLFFAFFVMNTLRPIISGTDFMDGGGRRGN